MEQARQEQDRELVEEWVAPAWGAGRAVDAWAVSVLAPAVVAFARVAARQRHTKEVCHARKSSVQAAALV